MQKILPLLLMVQLFFFVKSSYSQELWGVGSSSTYPQGVIYKQHLQDTGHVVIKEFPKIQGNNPIYSKLCLANNEKFYGLTRGYDNGTLYEYDPLTERYTVLYSFPDRKNGYRPLGSLIQASNGKLYGMTNAGGSGNNGVIFEFDLSNDTYKIIYNFNSSSSNPKGIGINPEGSLVQADNGKLYGMTYFGGENRNGVIFEFDLSEETYRPLHDFEKTETGSWPIGSLIQAKNGDLYGMTSEGGSFNQGVLFQFALKNDSFIKIIDFNEKTTGKNPHGSLMEAENGLLYGMTYDGNLFEFSPSTNDYNILVNLTLNGRVKGYRPTGDILEDTDGMLYGMTSGGGKNGNGTLFCYDREIKRVTKLIDFKSTLHHSESNGSEPFGSLAIGPNGNLFGVTSEGGSPCTSNQGGVLFEYNQEERDLQLKVLFNNCPHGSSMIGASLLQAWNGNLYGSTYRGGKFGLGVIFEFNPRTNELKTIMDHEKKYEPYKNNLVMAKNGKIYYYTASNSSGRYARLSEFDPISKEWNEVHTFENEDFFGSEFEEFVQSKGGLLYSFASEGGAHKLGTLVSFNPMNLELNKIRDLKEDQQFFQSFHDYMVTKDTSFFGVTTYGGRGFDGGFHQLSNGKFAEKYSFDYDERGVISGTNPEFAPIEGKNGELYVVTSAMGKKGHGTISVYSKGKMKKLFDVGEKFLTREINPNLIMASNGMIYGNSSFHHFKFNPENSEISLISKSKIGTLASGKLLEIKDCYHQTYSIIDSSVCGSMTSPSGRHIWTTSNQYVDTIPNKKGCDSIYIINLTISPISKTVIDTTIDSVFFLQNGIKINRGGVYFDSLKSNLGCDSVIKYKITHVGLVERKKTNPMSIYPNPSNEQITVKLLDKNIINAYIIDELGRKVMTFKPSIDEIKLNLNSGVYFVLCSTKHHLYRKKVVVL